MPVASTMTAVHRNHLVLASNTRWPDMQSRQWQKLCSMFKVSAATRELELLFSWLTWQTKKFLPRKINASTVNRGSVANSSQVAITADIWLMASSNPYGFLACRILSKCLAKVAR